MKKSFVRFAYSLFFMSLIAAHVSAQDFPGEYVSSVWTSQEGLPANTITDVMQSSEGYIYLGTYEGLVKTDGVKFEIINRGSNPDFNCSSARKIIEDSRKNLWIGSNDDGIAKFDGKKYSMYTVDSGLPNNSIRNICEDVSGNIWIGTADGVCYISPEDEVIHPKGLENVDGGHLICHDLFCDTAGRIWLVTTGEEGIFVYSKGEFSRWTALKNYGKFYYSTITQDASGAFWIGLTNGGAVKFADGKTDFYNTGDFKDLTIFDIFCDSTRAMWFATEKGIFQLRNDVFSKYDESLGLTSNSATKIMEDREGNIWIATDKGGVERMRLSKFRTQKLPASINSISEDKNGQIWLGSDNGLFCRKINGEYIENDLTKMIQGVRVRHTGTTKDGSILVSCYSKFGQVLMSQDGKITSWTTKDGLAGEKTRVAIEGSDGNLYVGTTTGLSVISKDGKIKNFHTEDGLNNDYIMAIFEDSFGNIWVGTDGGGINILKDGNIIKSYTVKDGLSGNVIFKINEFEKLIWICTGSGLTCFNGTEFTAFGTQSGLGSSSIFQMIPDCTNIVWMTSNRGISSVPMQELKDFVYKKVDRVYPKYYTKGDGLKIGGVTSTSLSLNDSLDRIWFTLIDGYAIYDPFKSKALDVAPLVKIADITADNVSIPLENTVKLRPGTKRLLVNYTGFSFASPETMRFKYKLTGFDEEFSPITSDRSAFYTNLKPGKYTFVLSASTGDGKWSETDEKIIINLKPYFYQRISFWIFSVIFVALIIFLFVQMKLRSMMRIQKQLELKVAERTQDLENEKDKSEKLLLNILPQPVAERLKKDDSNIIADLFTDATVLFSDIKNFTKIASNHTAREIVGALNDLFYRFDVRAEKEGIEKIKTIGDAYMAASGLPNPQPDHISRMIKFAAGMYEDLADYNKTSSIKFSMRIGINTGSVIAGIIGKNKFIYDIWGDTVNVASRMESAGIEGDITVSEMVKNSSSEQEKNGEIRFENPREYEVKGKGKMTIYTARV